MSETGVLLPILFSTVTGFLIQAIILGCVVSGILTIITAASVDQVKPKDMPLAFSFVTFFYAVGQFIGPVVAGWLIEDFGGFRPQAGLRTEGSELLPEIKLIIKKQVLNDSQRATFQVVLLNYLP